MLQLTNSHDINRQPRIKGIMNFWCFMQGANDVLYSSSTMEEDDREQKRNCTVNNI